MGEMADYLLEQSNYDIGFADNFFFGRNYKPRHARSFPFSKVCKYCKTGGLDWGKDDLDKWRLFSEDGEVHICDKYTNKVT